MQRYKLKPITACLLCLCLLTACGASQPTASNPPPEAESPATMSGIKQNQEPLSKNQALADRLGEEVRVSGRFAGYSGSCIGDPPMSRSDWMLEMPEGCIFVHGATPLGFSSVSPPAGGKNVSVAGIVRKTQSGMIYLEHNPDAAKGRSGFSKAAER